MFCAFSKPECFVCKSIFVQFLWLVGWLVGLRTFSKPLSIFQTVQLQMFCSTRNSCTKWKQNVTRAIKNKATLKHLVVAGSQQVILQSVACRDIVIVLLFSLKFLYNDEPVQHVAINCCQLIALDFQIQFVAKIPIIQFSILFILTSFQIIIE